MATSDITLNSIEIPLTQGYFAIVDEVDIDLAEHKWCLQRRGTRPVYAVRVQWISPQKHPTILMHRVILGRMLGIELTRYQYVDHISGDGLDNRRANLRLVTSKQNCMNMGLARNNKSGVTGVSWDKVNGKWMASIQVDGVANNLGRFQIFDDAVKARRQAEIEYFGEFGVTLSRRQS